MFARTQAGGDNVRKDHAYCSVGGRGSALSHAAISRNDRGGQDGRPRVNTLLCPTPPHVGRGGKVACPQTAAPVVAQADHSRERRAPPRGARRATSAARRWGPLQSRSASPTLSTLDPTRPAPLHSPRGPSIPPIGGARCSPLLCHHPAPAPTSRRVCSSTTHACIACAPRRSHHADPATPSCAGRRHDQARGMILRDLFNTPPGADGWGISPVRRTRCASPRRRAGRRSRFAPRRCLDPPRGRRAVDEEMRVDLAL
jgi:hypothetical protein